MRNEPAVIVRRAVGPPPFALRLAAVLAVPLLLYALVATGQKAVDNYRLNREADGLRAEVLGLREQNLALQHEIEQARGDAAIETIAREQLNLVRPGDHPVVLLASSSTADAAGTSPPATDVQAQPVWRQWWEFFFH